MGKQNCGARRSDDDALIYLSKARVRANQVLFLALFVMLSIWMYLYTDFFPLFSSIIGLSGALIVVPAIYALLPDSDRLFYITRINRFLFGNRTATATYIFFLLAGALTGFGGARPLELEYAGNGPTRRIELRLDAAETEEPDLGIIYLNPGSIARRPVWAPFWTNRFVTAAVNGLPERRVPVKYLSKELVLPDDLWKRPVLLLHPALHVVDAFVRERPTLEIEITPANKHSGCKEMPWRRNNYIGTSFWLGTRTLLELPAPIVARLNSAANNAFLATGLDEQKTPALKVAGIVTGWANPEIGCITTVERNATLDIRVRNKGDGKVAWEKRIEIADLLEFPHVVELLLTEENL